MLHANWILAHTYYSAEAKSPRVAEISHRYFADAMEAVIGASYLSGGIGVAGELVHGLFDPLIEVSSELGAGLDWKTSLQEVAAEADLGLPEYHVSNSGPDHAKEFYAMVRVGMK